MSAGISGTPPLSVQGQGGCHQLGEIRPRANQQGPISYNADRHYPGEDFSDGLSDCQISRSSRQIPSSVVSFCKDVAADPRLYGLIGTVCSSGQGEDSSPSVAAEVALVPSFR